MKALRYVTLAVVVTLSGFSQAEAAVKKTAGHGSEKEKLIGAWRLVAMEEPGADGRLNHITDRKGMLLYTRDGQMSVQIMFPESEAAVSNDYVQNGYEASFGGYDVNEETHTVTHHVTGSLTRGLLGKDLPRVYQFSNQYLIIRSSRPDEHWSVMWEHY